jgi:hypothetical protein
VSPGAAPAIALAIHPGESSAGPSCKAPSRDERTFSDVQSCSAATIRLFLIGSEHALRPFDAVFPRVYRGADFDQNALDKTCTLAQLAPVGCGEQTDQGLSLPAIGGPRSHRGGIHRRKLATGRQRTRQHHAGCAKDFG